jgi:hypothetical protein
LESENSRRIAVTLTRHVEEGADAARVADAVVSIWQTIDAALRPILGQQGVATLYKRSLFLVGPTHAWLAVAHEGIEAAMDLAALRSVLARQDSTVAAAGGGDLLQTFYELLASLIGPSLTERLLHPVWANTLSGSSQDTSS